MELHDAPAHYLFKLWPWVEANRTRLIIGGGIIIVAAGLISFHFHQRTQREIDAGIAMTQAMLTDPRDTTVEKQAGLFLKVASDYSGTAAGQRAMLQSAALLFGAQKFADAQTQFQQFLSQYPGSTLAAQAALGVAACLDAQGKMDPAAAAYQRVFSSYSDSTPTLFAKYRLAQIYEQQGKAAEALNFYESIARDNPGSPFASEAGLRAMRLKAPPAPAATSPAPAAPLKLNP
jgi:predicted negative regulator of RcsB-dependent stress response